MIKAIISARHFFFFLVILALSVETVNGTTPKRQIASSSTLIAPQLTPAKVRKMLPVDEHFTTYMDGEQQYEKCNKCGEEYKIPDSMTLAMKNNISNGCAHRKVWSPIWKIGLFEKSNDGKTAVCKECEKNKNTKYRYILANGSNTSLKKHLFSAKHKDSKYAEEFKQLENQDRKDLLPIWKIDLFKPSEDGKTVECKECKKILSLKIKNLKRHLFSAKHANSKYVKEFKQLEDQGSVGSAVLSQSETPAGNAFASSSNFVAPQSTPAAASKNKSSPVWDSGIFEKVNENGKNWAVCRKCNKKLTMNKHSSASLLTHPCYKEWARNNSVGPPNLSGNISQQSFNGGQQPTINMTPAEDPFWQDLYNKSSAENGFDLNNYLAQHSTTAAGNNSSNPSSSNYGMETQFPTFWD
ncbi:hypothetical protein niasHT_000601 [Heterodera trifolii]|uniref:BED-type domain-containing protein n=1 Tax=Heterodera trifolii TaxID=157864 RepID=A0ABD2LZ15_9BILA